MQVDTEPDAIVNRDDPIPILKIESEEPDLSNSPQRKHRSPSPRRIKNAIDKTATSSVQDRLYSLMFQQIWPQQPDPDQSAKPDRRSRKYVERPGFSVGRMSKNFRTFNSRCVNAHSTAFSAFAHF